MLVLISKGTVKKPTKWQLHDLGIRCLLWIREREHPESSGRV